MQSTHLCFQDQHTNESKQSKEKSLGNRTSRSLKKSQPLTQRRNQHWGGTFQERKDTTNSLGQSHHLNKNKLFLAKFEHHKNSILLKLEITLQQIQFLRFATLFLPEFAELVLVHLLLPLLLHTIRVNHHLLLFLLHHRTMNHARVKPVSDWEARVKPQSFIGFDSGPGEGNHRISERKWIRERLDDARLLMWYEIGGKPRDCS